MTHDSGAYFDLGPLDKGEEIRRVIIEQLVEMGFEVEAGAPRGGTGQHEIDFRYADALTTADNLTTFKFVVRNVANRFGFLASFMPKPIEGINGSGMHTHQSLFRGKDLPVVIYLALIIAFGVVSLGMAMILRPARPTATKLETTSAARSPSGRRGCSSR